MHRRELRDVERALSGCEILGDDADQHQQRAGERVQDELDRGVARAWPFSPPPEQEVGRDQHRLPEHVEQHQVDRQEGARHAGLQQQQQREETRLRNGRQRRRQHRDQRQERIQNDQPERDAVDAQVIVDVVVGDPRRPFDELVAVARRVECQGDVQRQRQSDCADDHRRPLGEAPRQRRHQHGAHCGDEPNGSEHQNASRTRRIAAASTAPTTNTSA